MKRLIVSLLILSLLAAGVLADTRIEDKDEPIEKFKVFKWVSPSAENKVVVYTAEGGDRGTVVIDLVSEDDYAKALEIAKELLNTKPSEYSSIHGTPFAIVRKNI